MVYKTSEFKEACQGLTNALNRSSGAENGDKDKVTPEQLASSALCNQEGLTKTWQSLQTTGTATQHAVAAAVFSGVVLYGTTLYTAISGTTNAQPVIWASVATILTTGLCWLMQKNRDAIVDNVRSELERHEEEQRHISAIRQSLQELQSSRSP